jgi:hypothetical protein
MPQICSCGAQLVSDAIFCHKCGKPLHEIAPAEPDSTASVPVMTIVPPPPPVNFHNRAAMRVAGLMAVMATLLFFLPYLNWLAAGFFSALLYRRRTGYLLSLESGVRLGWITGVLMFVIVMVLLTVSLALVNAAGGFGALPPDVRNALDPKFQEAMKALQSGPAIAELLVMLFTFITLLSMAGGALGAKLGGRSDGTGSIGTS